MRIIDSNLDFGPYTEEEEEVKVVNGQRCLYCKRAAFYWRRIPMKDQKITAEMAYVNFKNRKFEPKNFEPMKCQWCHKDQKMMDVTDPEYFGSFYYESGLKF